MNPPTYQPFSNGSEFMDWCAHNCEQCHKGPAPDLQGPNERCEIENAFALAAVCGGTLLDEVIGTPEHTASLAQRLGWDGRSRLPARCPEFSDRSLPLPESEDPAQILLFPRA